MIFSYLRDFQLFHLSLTVHLNKQQINNKTNDSLNQH
jgi:hypothetical protein